MVTPKRILWLFLLVAGIIVMGKIIPQGISEKRLRNIFGKADHQESEKSSPAKKINSSLVGQNKGDESWKQKFLDSIKVQYKITEKEINHKNASHWKLNLPKGKSLVNYSLELLNICNVMQIESFTGRVKKSSVPTLVFKMAKEGYPLTLTLRHSKKFLYGSAKFSIVFNNLDNINAEDTQLLNKLNWSHTLIVNPYTKNNILLQHITTGKPSVLTQLALEPFEYPFQNPGEGTILIHHSKKEIKTLLMSKMALLKSSSGFATYFGSRAVENKIFLNHLAEYMQANQLAFLDLTNSNRSYSIQVTRKFEVLCRTAKNFSEGIHLNNFLTKKMIASTRYGEALVVIPYSQKRIKEINTFLKANNLPEKGIELVTFSQLEHY